MYILCECKWVFTCVNVQFNVERCIWGAATDFLGIFKNVNLKMCAINFDNFRTDPRELLSGKHKTPTQKGKKNKKHINSVIGKQAEQNRKITGDNFTRLNTRMP